MRLILRWCLSTTFLDRFTYEKIRKAIRVVVIKKKLREKRLGWFGHVMKRNKYHMTCQQLNCEKKRRSKGDQKKTKEVKDIRRPKLRW